RACPTAISCGSSHRSGCRNRSCSRTTSARSCSENPPLISTEPSAICNTIVGMARPVIAFLTDFGTRDHYAGTMKGVALGICPDATLVDISHDVPAHDVVAGALELAAAYKYFPAGTIFLVVVDPGVGSTRRGIA